jgi:hypothetical protein
LDPIGGIRLKLQREDAACDECGRLCVAHVSGGEAGQNEGTSLYQKRVHAPWRVHQIIVYQNIIRPGLPVQRHDLVGSRARVTVLIGVTSWGGAEGDVNCILVVGIGVCEADREGDSGGKRHGEELCLPTSRKRSLIGRVESQRGLGGFIQAEGIGAGFPGNRLSPVGSEGVVPCRG